MILGIQTLSSPSAFAACPTADNAYNNAREGSINAGLYEVRWQVFNIQDVPCSKVRTIDQSNTQANCIEVSLDWLMTPRLHYDSRNYINCHQSYWEQRVISEQNAGGTSPWQYISAMRWLRICGRDGGMWGSRMNCVDRVTTDGTSFTPPDQPGPYGDFWTWNTGGGFTKYEEDPP